VLDEREPKISKRGDTLLQYPPKVLYVKFNDAAWSVEGMKESGTYPVTPISKYWHVDQQEKTLKVKRTQQPVAPDYARTAYNSQGMTLPAAIVDLCFDENMDPATAYVSLSRVKVADDILIMQAFNLKPFTQGSPLGPRLLLKKLRGEDIQPDIDQHLEQERQQREEERIAKAEAAQAKEAKQTERAAKKRERDNRKYDAMPEQEKAKRHKGAKERLDKSPQAAERKKQQDQDHERDRKRPKRDRTDRKRPKRDRTDRVITIDQRERRRLAAERYRERMRSQ